MDTHSSILAWRIPGTEESNGLQSMESQSDATEQLSAHTHAQHKEHLSNWIRPRVSPACKVNRLFFFLMCKK